RVHGPDRQGEIGWKLVRTGSRDEHLPAAFAQKAARQASLALAVELGEDIIEQQGGLSAARLSQRRELEQFERHRGAALLTGRTEVAQRLPTDVEGQVVAVRTYRRHSPSPVLRHHRLERGGPG